MAFPKRAAKALSGSPNLSKAQINAAQKKAMEAAGVKPPAYESPDVYDTPVPPPGDPQPIFTNEYLSQNPPTWDWHGNPVTPNTPPLSQPAAPKPAPIKPTGWGGSSKLPSENMELNLDIAYMDWAIEQAKKGNVKHAQDALKSNLPDDMKAAIKNHLVGSYGAPKPKKVLSPDEAHDEFYTWAMETGGLGDDELDKVTSHLSELMSSGYAPSYDDFPKILSSALGVGPSLSPPKPKPIPSAFRIAASTHNNPADRLGGMEKYLEYLQDNGVSEDTIQRIKSGELPIDDESRMRRARQMGLDTETPFLRLDVPGRTTMTRPELANGGGTPGRSTDLVYSAPTYHQASMGNQTPGQQQYPLLFPRGILGLHPQGGSMWTMGDESDALRSLLDKQIKSRRAAPWDGDRWPKGTPIRQYQTRINENGFQQLEDTLRGFDTAPHFYSELEVAKGVEDPKFFDMSDEERYQALKGPVEKAMRESFLAENKNFRNGLYAGEGQTATVSEHFNNATGLNDGTHGAGNVLHFTNMDFGLADLLREIGYTGSVVADETGMSVTSFYPERVRHKDLAVLDPKAKRSSNIFQSLLAPVGAAGAAAAAQSQENR